MLAGSLIKKVIMPPGAVTLDDVDLDQVSVDYVINCAKKGDSIHVRSVFFFFFRVTRIVICVLVLNARWNARAFRSDSGLP